MNILYKMILYAHVCSAVLSIGPFVVLIPLLKKIIHRNTEITEVYLDIFRVTVRIVKHMGHVLVVSGVLLIWLGPWAWSTSWILATLGVMFGSVFFLARAFTPTIRIFNEPGQDQIQLAKKLMLSTWQYFLLLLVMLWFMVAKPVLW